MVLRLTKIVETLVDWLLVAAAILLAVLVAVKASGVPEILWSSQVEPYTTIRRSILVAILVCSLLQPGFVYKLYQATKKQKQAERLLRIAEACRLVLIIACHKKRAGNKFIATLGVHYWNVENSPIRFWGDRSRPLKKLYSLRMYEKSPSTVTWKEGVGAVGYAIKNKQNQVFDLRALNEAGSAGEAAFMALSPDERLSMEFTDWQKSKDYTWICVWVFSDDTGKVVDVVTLDSVSPNAVEIFKQMLQEPSFCAMMKALPAIISGGKNE